MGTTFNGHIQGGAAVQGKRVGGTAKNGQVIFSEQAAESYIVTFDTVSAKTGFTAFTNPLNAQKTTQNTASYAGGTITNSASIGSIFNFTSIWNQLPQSATVQSLVLYTSEYSANPSNMYFDVGVNAFTTAQRGNIISNLGGAANTNIPFSETIQPNLYTVGSALTIHAAYSRTGGNNMAVRLPYLYIAVYYI